MKYLSSMVVLWGAFDCQVRAEYLNWTYTSTPSVPGITVKSGANGGASVTLTDVAQAGAAVIPVIAYETQTSSTTPINFNDPKFNLALKITDGNNASGTLNFTGALNGALTATASSVVVTFSPVTTRAMTFDGHTYFVTIPPMKLAPPTSPQQDIMASVSVTNAGLVPPPTRLTAPLSPSHGTPEPTSLLLGSLGICGLCFGCWREHRAASQDKSIRA